ncbi:bifunctional hydroxymethylpyrimidine kinase/phosphomethylpyrimidine kinase [bacterium]|nr:bifunctional hydroxymethylpyrimidine kinase/phosphomethylpyrimidine kinase [bacterium]
MSVALTIAGSDPSGGAGLQADLKTFQHLGVYGSSVVTLLTVQNTQGVADVRPMEPDFVVNQLCSVLDDLPIQAVKSGALGNVEIIHALEEELRHFTFPLIVDPVMVSKHGHSLIDDDAVQAMKKNVFPHAFMITPNMQEASRLLAREITRDDDLEDVARELAKLGPNNVLIKGDEVEGEKTDVLWSDGQAHRFTSRYVHTKNTHGTGCMYSAAITANLVKRYSLPTAVEMAKRYVTRAIETNPGLGLGHGPVNFFAEV